MVLFENCTATQVHLSSYVKTSKGVQTEESTAQIRDRCPTPPPPPEFLGSNRCSTPLGSAEDVELDNATQEMHSLQGSTHDCSYQPSANSFADMEAR